MKIRIIKRIIDILSPTQIYNIFDKYNLECRIWNSKYGKYILSIIIKYPDKNWNWQDVYTFYSSRIKINWPYINIKNIKNIVNLMCNNHNKIKSLYDISAYADIDFIINHLDKNWDWRVLPHVIKKFNLNVLLENSDRLKLWPFIGFHKDITMEIIEKNIKKPLNWKHITEIASLNFIGEHLHNERWKWDHIYIMEYKEISIEFIKKHPHIEWIPGNMSKNIHMTPDIIEYIGINGIDKPNTYSNHYNWYFTVLLENHIIDFDFLLKHDALKYCTINYLSSYTPYDILKKYYPNFMKNEKDINYFIIHNNHLTIKQISNILDDNKDINVMSLIENNKFQFITELLKNRVKFIFIPYKISTNMIRHICTTFI